MMKQLYLLGASVALLASQSAFAICAGDIEMHGNQIINVAVSGIDGASDAVNKHYVDNYVKAMNKDRLNGTQLSADTATKKWTDAQDYCANLESKVIDPVTGSLSEKTYKDFHLPTRVEYISACLASGSTLDYQNQEWTADGQCQTDNDYFWLNTYHLGQIVGRIPGEIDYYHKYDTVQAGKAELFKPSTGDSIRDHGDTEHQVRCIR